MVVKLDLSERRACRLVGLARDSYRNPPVADEATQQLVEKIMSIAYTRRRFGYRRYNDDGDNAMNIGEWLPVTATFSACFQNNHHHFPSLLRLSHDPAEYDFGFMTVKIMKWPVK